MTINRKVATSVLEYIKIVDNIATGRVEDLWFRGQSNSSHKLVPGLLREATMVTGGRGQNLKKGEVIRSKGGLVALPSYKNMISEFKNKSRPFLKDNPSNDFEWMFLAQHYGLPTRLLDWSTNALVGLYFAASGASYGKDDESDACKRFLDGDDCEDLGFSVFIIDPIAVNNETIGAKRILDVAANFDDWSYYIHPEDDPGSKAFFPVCITAPHNSPRIHWQSGKFTLHGLDITAIESYFPLAEFITKIFFPYAVTRDILQKLIGLGITKSSIYPGLDSVAFDVKLQQNLKYDFYLEKHFKSLSSKT